MMALAANGEPCPDAACDAATTQALLQSGVAAKDSSRRMEDVTAEAGRLFSDDRAEADGNKSVDPWRTVSRFWKRASPPRKA